jgi:hypothetical protein
MSKSIKKDLTHLIAISLGTFVESAFKGAGVAFGAALIAKKFGVLPLKK